MTAIKIDNFAGIAPRYSARLLPNNGATRSDNCKLLSGELRGLHEAQLLKDFNTSPPVTGGLSQSAGGSLAATTYYVKSSWELEGTATSAVSGETSFAVSVNNVLNVAAPASPPAGATGWNVYVSTAGGIETKQNTSTIALGAAWVEPTTGLIAGTAPPTAQSPITRAFRIPNQLSSPTPIQPSDSWVSYFDPNVDFVRTPVLQDSFERYYWTGDSYSLGGAPQYNTRARILAGSAPYLLGVPTPVAAPTVAPPAGTTLTRAYLYTFVSGYGEEGPPSPPTTATGIAGTWVISGFDTTVPNASSRNITTVRIYRTVPGTTSSEYFWVADIALGSTSYNDTAADAVVALNFPLASLTWTPPPATLTGIVSHPGGFLVGFSGRDLYLSEPYHPHAYPVQYIQTCETEIVGVAIFGNVIVVCTSSHLYYGEGMSPLNVTLQKLQSIDPCVSRRSIVTTIDGVYYASTQGIVKFDGAQAALATYRLFTREEWQNYFSPTTVYAVPYGVQYIAFDTTASGFIFSPSEQLAPLTTLDRFSNVVAIQIDPYSGDAYLISSNQALLWDPPASIPYEYTWTSKEFDLPNPVNFGALRVKFAANPVQLSASQVAAYTTFNTGRIAKPLNTINLAPINGARVESVAGYVGPQIRNPVGGSPLFPITSLTSVTPAIQVNVFSRDLSSQWDQQFSWTVTTEGIYRMPAGYKSDGWQVQLIGNVAVYSFSMAETAKELKKL